MGIVAAGNGLAKLASHLLSLIATDVAALGIEQLGLAGQGALEAFLQCAVAVGSKGHAPGSTKVGTGVGQRTDERYLAFLLQRQQFLISSISHFLIFQQDEGLGGNTARCLTVLGREDILGMATGIAETIGILEKAELILSFQHTATGQVDIIHRYQSVVVALLQSLEKAFGAHVHIGAGMERLGRNPLQVLAHSMTEHLADAAVVGHHKAVVFPLVAEHIIQEPAVGRGRNTINDVERRHKRTGTGLGCGLIGREILVEHTHATHVDRVVVATGLGSTIEGEMLHAGHDVVNPGIVALIAAHHGLGDATAQIGIFAIALGRAAPAGIHADIDHG